MPASPPPADDSEELDEDDVFAEDVLPALEPVELLVLVATTAVAAATAAAADGSRRFGLILLDIGLPFYSTPFCCCVSWDSLAKRVVDPGKKPRNQSTVYRRRSSMLGNCNKKSLNMRHDKLFNHNPYLH